MPVPILYLLLIAGFACLFLKKPKSAKSFFIAGICWFLIISTSPVPTALVKHLEKQYSQLTDEEINALPDSCDIIILGGGHSDDKSLSPNNQLSTTALARLVEGIRIHRKIQGSRMIFSGWAGHSNMPQAVVLMHTAIMLGIDSSSIAIQPLARNTRMESEEYARLFGKEKKLVVVTSAFHMPRAMMLFNKAGINPVPAPADRIVKKSSVKDPWRWMPSSSNTGIIEVAVHEYVGILWNWIGGK